MGKKRYWLFGFMIVIVGAALFFRKELVVIGSVFELEEGVVALSEQYTNAKQYYSEKPDEAKQAFLDTKNIGGLLLLAQHENKRDEHCRYKRLAVESMTNPAIVEGMVQTDFFADDLCMMNKHWYAEVLKVSKASKINTLTLLRESGVEKPARTFIYKLEAILSD